MHIVSGSIFAPVAVLIISQQMSDGRLGSRQIRVLRGRRPSPGRASGTVHRQGRDTPTVRCARHKICSCETTNLGSISVPTREVPPAKRGDRVEERKLEVEDVAVVVLGCAHPVYLPLRHRSHLVAGGECDEAFVGAHQEGNAVVGEQPSRFILAPPACRERAEVLTKPSVYLCSLHDYRRYARTAAVAKASPTRYTHIGMSDRVLTLAGRPVRRTFTEPGKVRNQLLQRLDVQGPAGTSLDRSIADFETLSHLHHALVYSHGVLSSTNESAAPGGVGKQRKADQP